MSLLRHPAIRMTCLFAAVAGAVVSLRAAELLPLHLRELAATTTQPATWAALRTYAKSPSVGEWSGWAWFVAGYQEFVAQSYPQAAEDLAQAARADFPLADYATFYQASALSAAKRPQEAAAALVDFSTRFPHSPLQNRALTLRANALTDSQQAAQAIAALQNESDWRKSPPLALLLGQTYLKAQRPSEAALAFAEVYYHHPNSSQAAAANDALKTLRAQLGPDYPPPGEDMETARAEALANAGRYEEALKEYRGLAQSRAASPRLAAWQLGQARCLIHLHRAADALPLLAMQLPASDLEAQRLFLSVQAHAQQTDALGIAEALSQLETYYRTSSIYADALAAAGIFYYRQLDWQQAARAYQRLWELFPQNDHVREDGWRLAWCNYLLGDPKTPELMQEFLTRFPDSARAAAALFWWGRLQESQGAADQAQALYELLSKRFVHSYYALQAAPRLAALRTQAGVPHAGGSDSSASAATAIAPVLTPPTAPVGLACAETTPAEVTRPALILRAFGLKDVEGDYLRGALNGNNPPSEVRLLLAQIYAADKNPSTALSIALRIAPAYSQMEFESLPKDVWDMLYPRTYWPLVQRQARLSKLDPYLVMGLIRQESSFDRRALSVANARGLMQLLPETAAHSKRPSRQRTAARRLNDPAYNIRSGCAFLATLLKMFDDKPEYALAAYNAGDFRVRDWTSKYTFKDAATFMESIPIPATRFYVEAVLRDAGVYRQLVGGTPRFATCSALAHPANVTPRARGAAQHPPAH